MSVIELTLIITYSTSYVYLLHRLSRLHFDDNSLSGQTLMCYKSLSVSIMCLHINFYEVLFEILYYIM